MKRLRYFVEALSWARTWRLQRPDGWQGVVVGYCGPAFPTRLAARRWCVRRAWRLARENATMDRRLP